MFGGGGLHQPNSLSEICASELWICTSQLMYLYRAVGVFVMDLLCGRAGWVDLSIIRAGSASQ